MTTTGTGTQKTDWTFVNRMIMTEPPSIIPGVRQTIGNRLLSLNLWRLLYASYMTYSDLKRLDQIAKNYLLHHKSKTNEIKCICAHFTHIMGLHYEVFSDAFNEYGETI